MVSMNSKGRRIPDLHTSVTLRALGLAALTAATNGASLALASTPMPKLTQAYWDNKEIAASDFGVQFHVESADRTTGDEVYTLVLEGSTDNFAASAVTLGQIAVISAGYYEVKAAAEDLEAVLADISHVRVRLAVAGTTPSIQFGAFLFHQDW